MALIKKFGEIMTDQPPVKMIRMMREVCDKELENGLEREKCNNLYEVYYYLKTGSLSGAWRKINNLEEELRFKIPGSIYDSLKETCKEMDITIA
jgi:hypothetical protein